MQTVLAIDTTVEPAQAHLVRVGGKALEVIESHSSNLGAQLSQAEFSALKAEAFHSFKQSLSGASTVTPQTEGDAADNSREEGARILKTIAQGFKDLVNKFQSPWTTSVLIVPTPDYLSINMDLPFKEQKSISRIINFEVQDVVPFDVNDFLIQPRFISARSPGSYDVHVSLIFKSFVRNVLNVCKFGNIEPLIVTTPASVIAALYHLAPDYFVDNSAVILCQERFYSLAFKIDGEVRCDRVLDGQLYDASRGPGSLTVLSDIKLSLAHVERRYERKIERIFFVGDPESASFFKQSLGRSVEVVNLKEFVRASQSQQTNQDQLSLGVAGLSALFAQDVKPPQILTNFRVNEFAFSPQLQELFGGLKKLLPYFGALLLAVAVTLLGLYASRQVYRAKLESTISEYVRAALPDTPIAVEGMELAVLSGESQKMATTLKDLGSLSSMSPLAVFLHVSNDMKEAARDLKNKEGTDATELTIKSGVIFVKGNVPDYSAADSIRQHMERVKKPDGGRFYCGVKMTVSRTTTPGKTTRPFELNMQVCDESTQAAE